MTGGGGDLVCVTGADMSNKSWEAAGCTGAAAGAAGEAKEPQSPKPLLDGFFWCAGGDWGFASKKLPPPSPPNVLDVAVAFDAGRLVEEPKLANGSAGA